MPDVRADLGREAVYAAEIAAFDGTSYEVRVPLDELRTLARRTFDAGWWPCGEIEIRAARSDAASSSTRRHGGATPVIRLATPQMTPATLVHELAHVLAGVDHGHGGRFRRAHLDLVTHLFGDTPAQWLRDAYAAMELAPGRRAWQTPPVPHAGPIAL